MSDLPIALGTTLVALVGVAFGAVSMLAARRKDARELRSRLVDLEALVERGPPNLAIPAKPPSSVGVPEPPSDLLAALGERHCVLFAGAGVRVAAGYPAYAELLAGAISDLDTGDGSWRMLREQLEAVQLPLVADLLRSRVAPARLFESISRRLAEVEIRDAPAVRALARLPFAGIITDDWSGYVARMFRRPGTQEVLPWRPVEFEPLLRGRKRFVVEAYGGLSSGRLVLGAEEYQAIIDEFRDYGRFMTSLLLTRSLLFVGASLVGVEQFLIEGGARANSRQQHWAFVPWQPDIELQAERLRERYGVRLLVHAGAPEHVALEGFAQTLLERVPSSQAPRSRAEEEPILTGLRLQNIGPFADFSLQLRGNYTILLGDNGSGKTSILRSVALGLAGENPVTEQFAQRTLKTGSSSGSIELISGRDTFRTELRSERKRVQIEAPWFTPVKAGLWLTIGFPALRGVSLRNPSGPKHQPVSGAGPDDLLPLLRDAPDTRLDDLKQWVVNTQLRADDPKSSNAAVHRQLLKDFFEIVCELMPGTDFEYTGVDRENFDVLLSSADGPISFDLLSRGMTAVLGWIGVLLQRMYEVYASDPDPTAQPVLLLVDEIDVHLHPEWQRSILPLLRKRFPRLHLLATTHSPLIVSSAGDAEIFHLARASNGELCATRVEGKFAGVSPDEILTSSAFAMETPLDLETDQALRDYTDLLARGLTPENDEKAAELAQQLGEPWIDRTPQEARSAELFREWLADRLAGEPEDQRRRMLGEAERYLNHLRTRTGR